MKNIKNKIKSFVLFFKELAASKDKKAFVIQNKESLKTHALILLGGLLGLSLFYMSMKPVVRGTCKYILQEDSDDYWGDSKVVGVEVKKAFKGTTLKQVKSIGVLKAKEEVVLKSELSGKIKAIEFKEGSEVQKDQALILFEDDYFKAERDKCYADYIQKKAEYERIKKLVDQKVGTQRNYDEAFGAYSMAKAQLEAAESNLSKTVIRAPFDGVIGIMKMSVGNIVQQQTDLVSMVDNSSVKVEFMVPAQYIQDIAEGQRVQVTLDAFRGKTFSGTVDAVDSEVDTRNHSILVRAIIPNDSGFLRHGLYANVDLTIGEKEGVLLVDEDAVMREGSMEFVWFVDDKKRAHRTRVLTGSRGDEGVEILGGVFEGEYVVTVGHLKLSEGTAVKFLNVEEDQSDDKDAKAEGGDKEPDTDKGSDESKSEDAQSDDKDAKAEDGDKEPDTDKGSDESKSEKGQPDDKDAKVEDGDTETAEESGGEYIKIDDSDSSEKKEED